jgi:hypothetical protein
MTAVVLSNTPGELPLRVQKYLAKLDRDAERFVSQTAAIKQSVIDQTLRVLGLDDFKLAKRLQRIRKREGRVAALEGLPRTESLAFNFIHEKAKSAGFRGKEIQTEAIAKHLGLGMRRTQHVLNQLEHEHKLIVRLRTPGGHNRFAITLPETKSYHRELQTTQFGSEVLALPPIKTEAGGSWSASHYNLDLGDKTRESATNYRLREAEDYKENPNGYDSEALLLSGEEGDDSGTNLDEQGAQ